jgi:uncharacterized membrane protein
MKKILMLCGVAAAILYVGTVILGGWLRPDYSHISMAISELVADGAPNRSLLSSSFLVYNTLLSVFGLGLLLKAHSNSRGRISGVIGSLTLLLVGLAGILMELAFPQEPGGTAATFTGIMHFVMAGVAALGTMVAILMLAFWFKNIPALKGGLGAAAMANHSPLFGLIERITIFTFTLWIFVIGWRMAQLEAEADKPEQFELLHSISKGS